MNAMAVPPPAWVPIGAREIQALSRRYLRLGLILSSLCHLALLATVSYVISTHPEAPPVWSYKMTTFVDPAPAPPVFPPTIPPSDRVAGGVDTGTPTPTDFPIDPKVTLPGAVTGLPTTTPGSETPAMPGATPQPNDLPEEGAFQPYDEEPVVLQRAVPNYPDWAREAGISGTVLLHVLVGTDGRVKRVTVIRDILGLTIPAREAAMKWIFRPAKSNRHPVAVWVEIPMKFSLE